MLVRIALFISLSGLAVLVAWLLQRRRPDPPSAPSYRAPTHLDRNDFLEPQTPILMVVFASRTCDTCPSVWHTVSEAEIGSATVRQRVEVQDDPELHKRYKVDGVPTTIVADAEGLVVQAFFGHVREVDIVEAIKRVQEPNR